MASTASNLSPETVPGNSGTKTINGKNNKKGKKAMATNENEVIGNEVNDNEASESQDQKGGIQRIQKTVFDLNTFQNVTLYRDVVLPEEPATLEEALSQVGNDTKRLLKLIHDGLVASKIAEIHALAKEGLLEDFHRIDPEAIYPLDREKTPLGELYSDAYALGEKKDMINQAVLGMAKMFGYDAKNGTPETNNAAKKQAMEIIRTNPVMMKSIQG